MKFDGIRIKIAQEDRPAPEVEQYKKHNPFQMIGDYFAPHNKVFKDIGSRVRALTDYYSKNDDITQEERVEDLNKVTSYMEEIAMYQGKSGYEELMQQLIQLEQMIDTPAFERR